MNALNNLRDVLCDSEGNVSTQGSSEDRAIIQKSLADIEKSVELLCLGVLQGGTKPRAMTIVEQHYSDLFDKALGFLERIKDDGGVMEFMDAHSEALREEIETFVIESELNEH